MKFFERRRRMKRLNAIKADIDVNLQNNYKSTAHAALTKFCGAVALEQADGVLSAAQLDKLRSEAARYTEMMKNYHH